MTRAPFITFEGGDGAGKTTLIDKVFRYLDEQGCKVVRTRAPGGTQIAAEIRQLLLRKHSEDMSPRCELLLFLADRAQHVDHCIKPALEAGNSVLCDRFNDSTLAYQGARGFDTQHLQDLLRFASGNLTPDLTFYLDLSPQIGFERTKNRRTGYDRIESEALVFHQNIRRAFQQIAKEEPKRFFQINAELSIEQVFQQAKEKIDDLFGMHRK
jgi:dTMP kinase